MEDPEIGIRGYFQWIADETPRSVSSIGML
jgi:hypothetical protein